ncbi:MAG TPA: response regulator transcription factor [Ktedonosporobacter sp.]|nr:response regulator transcription factor [Ktedonosporobacter sp.]
MTERLRVLIVDDQRLLCEGFRKLIELEPDLEVVGTAVDGRGALATVDRLSARRLAPDVVLMDVQMPRLDGIRATRALKERWPEIRVVILTTFDDRELIQAGLQAGTEGYVLKDITAEQPGSQPFARLHKGRFSCIQRLPVKSLPPSPPHRLSPPSPLRQPLHAATGVMCSS